MAGRATAYLAAGAGDGEEAPELEWPFGRLEGVGRDELRETAYEIFFTASRSSAGFSGRGDGEERPERPGRAAAAAGGGGGGGTGMMTVTSKVKRSLGLRTRRAAPPMRTMSQGGGGASPAPAKVRRPMTSAEIMRQQMGVTENSDHRLRKTVLRSLVGQIGRKVESIVLPLELLRHLKPAEFGDVQDYHQWQRRQLKIIEAGLVLHPSLPLERSNAASLRLQELVRASELRPLDLSKNSDSMRGLVNCVSNLAWRSPNNTPMDVCHWADGYPLNVHLYLSLLRSVFDLRDDTVVLDEVDELLELVKRTWATLGMTRMTHNVCFAWVLFEQYVETGQVEPELMGATLAMLAEVSSDARRGDREPGYVPLVSATLAAMLGWAERKLLDYHEGFERGTMGKMESVICLALTTARIMTEDVGAATAAMRAERDSGSGGLCSVLSVNRVDNYIRTSAKSIFTRVFENGNGNGQVDSMVVEVDEDPGEVLVQVAKKTEELARLEREMYSPVLKRWHPTPAAVAIVTFHNCFGSVLRQYLSRISGVTNESVRLFQVAAKLEKALVHMVVEDAADSEDGGKAIQRELVPYHIDATVLGLMKSWIHDRLRIGRDCINRTRDSETWNPKSKTEPYAQSAVELMKLTKVTVDEFFEINVGARDELINALAEGLDGLFQEYISFLASCGSKQSYLPTLPPLTRCNQDSKFQQIWKKAAPACKTGADPRLQPVGWQLPPSGQLADNTQHPRGSTSRGTQRLYVRLNTLHYLHAALHSIDKSLSVFSRGGAAGAGAGAGLIAASPSRRTPRHHLFATPSRRRGPGAGLTHFELARAAIHASVVHVAEVAAYRLVFLDCASYFFDSLYVGSVAEARARPALRSLKQNLAFLSNVLVDRAQPVAVREVMKASFEAFLTVLLAGGSGRAFARADYEMIAEDLGNLKRLFCTCGEGLVAEEVVEREAATVEGVVALMRLPTERLVEEFSVLACGGMDGIAGVAAVGAVPQVPLPPTTGRWHRSDANTVLRVLCHRDDEAANRFLKKAFQLPKRR